jgi:hypothetical protein
MELCKYFKDKKIILEDMVFTAKKLYKQLKKEVLNLKTESQTDKDIYDLILEITNQRF